MNILITGGTGFVGKRVVARLIEKGHTPYVLTRSDKKDSQVKYLQWNPEKEEFPEFDVDSIDGLINLMGENIGGKRWSESQKKKIENSRIEGTKFLNQMLSEKLTHNLKFTISASAVGIYQKNTSETLDEKASLDNDFLGSLCQKWEEQAKDFSKVDRRVIIRIGVVLGPDGGMLEKLMPIFKLGLGGPIGNGKMMMSWVHVDDLVNIIMNSIEEPKYEGIFNAVSPNPVTNSEFTKAFGKAAKRPAFFPVPPFALKLMMGEMSSLALDSQKIIPSRLQEIGHEFKKADIFEAMKDILES